ncbi:hypothetical protein PGT21_024873 [Puccinia graminis f. sp. tritici]|uniref:Uncharacterized protein n=1 Tax=Puccinia graminis f. sp. tritici TaxID=56615 RepID=A0A5B0LVG9_PUCGR|nr:hypothetical protein PGTUg99_022384 [Puccinia graminis f. sp. tritici]KAA1104490.1 hypothetical protein PGT21_024873 [Puccinia graminis f. sp. tritici]
MSNNFNTDFGDSDLLTIRNHFERGRRLTQQLIDDDPHDLDSSDSEDDEQPQRKHRRPNKDRSHIEHHEKLMTDYFNENPTYDSAEFAKRFQMERPLFLRILQDVTNQCP